MELMRGYLKRILVFGIAVSACTLLTGQSAHKYRLDADKQYRNDAYAEAETSYKKAGELKDDPQVQFNLGNTLYEQQRFEESAQHFKEAIEGSTDLQLRSRAYHNLGNAQYQAGNLEESVKSYVEALTLNPGDMQTKQNLTMALKQMQQQQQQQQQQQEGQENEEQQEEQQQQEQQQGEQENEEQDQQDQQQDGEGEEQQEEQPQPQNGGEEEQPPEPQDLSRENAEDLLKIIENEDQQVQEKLRKAAGKKGNPEKDW